VGDISGIAENKLLKKACEEYGKQGSRLTKELLRFRDKIEVGDPVIAYRLDNTVLAVGRITSGYFFDKRRNKDSKERTWASSQEKGGLDGGGRTIEF